MHIDKPKTSRKWGKPLEPGLDKALSRFVTSAACMFAMGTLVSGQFLTGYALLLGARDFEIGLLASVATWAGLSSLLSPMVIRALRSGKLTVLWSQSIGRSSWLIVILPALFGYGAQRWVLWLLIAVSGFYTLSNSIVYPAWLSWLRSLVPTTIRGRFFARQSATTNFTAMAVLQLGGQFLDVWKRHFGKKSPFGFTICYGFGLIVASLGLSIRRKIPELPSAREDAPVPLLRLMVLPLTNPAFRAYILFYSWYYFSVMIITPFLMVYMLNYLKISYATIALLTNMGTLAVFFSATIWGRLIDKFSPKSVLKLCYPAMCLLIPLLLLATPGNFLILYLFHFLAGLFSCGLNLSLTNTVLRIAPDEHASAYFAAENAIVSLAGTAGPLLGGWLAQSVQGVQTHLGGLTIVHLHFVFLAAMAVRLCGFFLLRRLREPRERDVGHMLRVMRRVPGLRPMGATRSAVDALVALLHPLIRRSRSHTPLPPRPHPDDEPPLEDQDKSDDR